MIWKAEIFEKLFGKEIGQTCSIRCRLTTAFEWRFLGAIEDEERLYRQSEKSEQAVVECSQSRIFASFA